VLVSLRSPESQRSYRRSIEDFVGIRRVKGARKLGVRLGNWLTVNEARSLWQLPNMHTAKGKRDRAILAVLLGCGLRRRELIDLTLDHIQRREDHWAIVDLVGKGGHIRTVPMPDWVKQTIDQWVGAAEIAHGRIFRCVCRRGVVWRRTRLARDPDGIIYRPKSCA
jgi:site-specific recombinase XerD